MKKKFLLLFVSSSFLLFSCSKDNTDTQPPSNPNTVNRTADTQATGILYRQAGSSYMYGTHIIVTSTGYYALKSTAVNLDQYNNQSVTITGIRVAGYPVDGGPMYIDVLTIK